MAQQGAGNPGWPLSYDDGSGFGLSAGVDGMDGFIDINDLAQHHPLEAWPSTTTSGAVQDFAHESHQGQFALAGHQQLSHEYTDLAGGGHLPPDALPVSTQQSWPTFRLQAQNGQATPTAFPVSAAGGGHGFQPTSQNESISHSFAGHAPGQFAGNQDLSATSAALDNAGVYLQQTPMNDDQWRQQQQQQQQQRQQHQIQAALQQQQQQQLAQRGSVPELVNLSYAGPLPVGPGGMAQPRQTPAPARPSASPAPRQSTVTPDVISQQSNSPAGSVYQSPAPQNWPGVPVGGHGSPLTPAQQMHLQQQQQQQQQQQLHFQQMPPQASPAPSSAPSATPTPAAPLTKATKAAKVTKPKAAPKTTAKAKQVSQALQDAAQSALSGTPQPQQQPQPYLEQQQVPQQIQAPGAGPTGWQQFAGANANQALYQQGSGEGLPVGAQIWPGQQHQQQLLPQQAGQLRIQQYQPPFQQQKQQSQPQKQPQAQPQQLQQQQQQQQQRQLEQQRYLQQMQMQQQQQLLRQQQNVQSRTGMTVTPIPPPQIGQQRPFQPSSTHQQGQSRLSPSLARKPAPSSQPQSAQGVPAPATVAAATITPAVRAKVTKTAAKKAPLSDSLPKQIPHLVMAADTLERQQLFPGAKFLALGNSVSIEPPLSTTEPAVLPDPTKELGKRHFPGRKASLPCEIVAEYDRRVSSQPPETKEALVLELRSKLKSQGKTLPPKVYKFASFGDLAKKTTKTTSQGPATMESPESDEEEEEEIRSATRPTDPADAAAWDAIGFVYVTDNGPSTIKRAVKSFGDFIKGIYDGIKETKERLKKAEESNAKKDAVDQLKKMLASKQELLYRAVDAADEKGHEQVLENLGGNGPLVANLVSALRDCVNASDFNGKLPKTLLRFMSQFTTVTDEMLNQKLKFDKIQKRFMSKGDEEVKGLVDEIVSKTVHAKPAPAPAPARPTAAKPAVAKPAATAKPTGTSTSVASGAATAPTAASIAQSLKAPSRVPSDSLSAKRAREDEPDVRSSKKIAANSAGGAPHAVSKPASSMSGPTASSVAVAAPVKPWAGTALLPGKSRPATKPAAAKADSSSTSTHKTESAAKEAAKDSGKTSSTGSPIKRETASAEASGASSGAGGADSSAVDAVARPKKAAVAKVEPSASKLGALLDEISKPKSSTPAAPTPESSSDSAGSSNETPEEKAKRLRKESRRKLRVTWKSGDELTQVRVFKKDKGEDEGRAKYLLRDAGDDRSEGLALKRSLKKGANGSGLNDDDEDDDTTGGSGMDIDDEEDELPYRPWFEPSPISFAPLVDKSAKTFVTRGGNLAVDTAEQKAMAERENTVLIAIYTDPSDIPPTPKSPVRSYNELPGPVGISLPTTDAKLQELQIRWNEERTFGAKWAAWNALKRLEALRQPGGSTQPVAVAAQPDPITSFAGPRAGDVVRLLTSDAVKNWKPTMDLSKTHAQRWQNYTDTALQHAVEALESLVQRLRDKPFPATEPPEYITDTERIKEWWTGYNREKQREKAQAGAEAEALRLAAGQGTPAGQQPDAATAAAWAAYYAQFNPQQQQQQQAADPNAYAQYVAAYYQQQQQQAAAQGSYGGDTNDQLQALLATLGGGSAQPGAPYAAAGTTDTSLMLSLVQWAAGQQQQQQQQQQQAGADAAGSGQQHGQDAHRPGNGHAAHESPHDRHGRNKRDRDTPDTSVPNHLRGINRALIGTKACVFWASGKCAKGDKCTFRHD